METVRITETEKQIRLWPHQTKALLSDRRFIGLIGGTGGGKTFFGPLWMYNEIEKDVAADNLREEYIIAAPTYRLLLRATLPMFQDQFTDTEAEGRLNKFEMSYTLPWGGKVWFGSADKPQSLEAGQYKAAWLDEAGQMKYMAWVAIQARLGFKKGRGLLTTTPYGMNWLYHNFYKNWQRGDKEYDIINFLSIDNPLYPKDEYERARRDLSPELFDMRYRGLFRKLEGLVFADFNADNVYEPFPLPGSWPRFGGTDFGFNNPHVNLKAALSHDDVLYVFNELYMTQTLLADIAPFMLRIPFLGDPEGLREIKELVGHGVNIRSGTNDKALCRELVNARIRNNTLKISTDCIHTLDEIETYHFKPGTDKPEKVDDHCMEALLQLVYHVDRVRHRRIGRVHHKSKPPQPVDRTEIAKQTMNKLRKPSGWEEDIKPEQPPAEEAQEDQGGQYGRKKGRVHFRR